MLKEVRFDYRHDNCWLQEASERYDEITLVISSIYMVEDEIHVDMTVHAESSERIDTLQEEWEADDRIRRLDRVYDGPRGTRFHVAYTEEHSIYPHIIHHTPVAMGSVRIAQGTEHYQIVGEAEDLRALVEILGEEGEAELQSVLEVGPEQAPDPGALGVDLTDRQVDALLVAHAEGYYRWPRDRSASDLASELDVSVSTFLEHLRQAESRVLDAFVLGLRERQPARYNAVRARLRNGDD